MPVIVRTTVPSDLALQITRAAAEAGASLGETIDALISKATRAARLTDPNAERKANRRYEDLAFYVEGGTIYGVWPYRPKPAAPNRPTPAPPQARPRPVLSAKFAQSATTVQPTAPLPDGLVEISHPPCNGVGCPACRYTGIVRTQKP